MAQVGYWILSGWFELIELIIARLSIKYAQHRPVGEAFCQMEMLRFDIVEEEGLSASRGSKARACSAR